MKVLVTGGAGYIGSHVVHELTDAGYQPTVFDNFYSGDRINVPANVPLIEGDITVEADINRALEGMDAVIHLAALKAAGESMLEPEKYAYQNISGGITLLNAMVRNGVKNLIFSSSAAVYGDPATLPITEETPVAPINFYGFTKLQFEMLCGWYVSLGKLNFAALRYFNVAGYDVRHRVKGLEKNPNNLFPIIMETLQGTREILRIFGTDYQTHDGTAVRDYIHVNDLATAHIGALKYIVEQEPQLIVNLGTSNGLSVKEAVTKAEQITGITINKVYEGRRPGDPDKLLCDYTKAQKRLGWKPRHSDAETIIRSMLDVYGLAT